MDLLYSCFNISHDSCKISHDCLIGIVSDTHTDRDQILFALLVVFSDVFLRVGKTINLDDQLALGRIEINDVRSDRLLTFELRRYGTISKRSPELLLRQSGSLAKLSGL